MPLEWIAINAMLQKIYGAPLTNQALFIPLSQLVAGRTASATLTKVLTPGYSDVTGLRHGYHPCGSFQFLPYSQNSPNHRGHGSCPHRSGLELREHRVYGRSSNATPAKRGPYKRKIQTNGLPQCSCICILVLAVGCARSACARSALGTPPGSLSVLQMALMPVTARTAWKPDFVDYLYLAFNTSTAFSPADLPAGTPAKLMRMVQSMIFIKHNRYPRRSRGEYTSNWSQRRHLDREVPI